MFPFFSVIILWDSLGYCVPNSRGYCVSNPRGYCVSNSRGSVFRVLGGTVFPILGGTVFRIQGPILWCFCSLRRTYCMQILKRHLVSRVGFMELERIVRVT